MKENVEFLNYIYQNAQMGAIGINDIINAIDDENLSKKIEEQLADYEKIVEECLTIFKKYGKERLPEVCKAHFKTYNEV